MTVRLDLVVGCNGAGKSTLITTFLQPRLPQSLFVNADVIAAERWPADPEGNSYRAAQIAEQLRNSLIDAGRPLIAETVFSHPSKLTVIDRAHARGYRVVLHAVMIPVDEAVHRVATRVADGGHAVPETKIRQRYARLWPLVADAVRRADRAIVYDNSSTHMEVVARFTQSIPSPGATWPTWAPPELIALAPTAE